MLMPPADAARRWLDSDAINQPSVPWAPAMLLADIDMTVASVIGIGVAIMAAVAISIMRDVTHQVRDRDRDDYDWDI